MQRGRVPPSLLYCTRSRGYYRCGHGMGRHIVRPSYTAHAVEEAIAVPSGALCRHPTRAGEFGASSITMSVPTTLQTRRYTSEDVNPGQSSQQPQRRILYRPHDFVPDSVPMLSCSFTTVSFVHGDQQFDSRIVSTGSGRNRRRIVWHHSGVVCRWLAGVPNTRIRCQDRSPTPTLVGRSLFFLVFLSRHHVDV